MQGDTDAVGMARALRLGSFPSKSTALSARSYGAAEDTVQEWEQRGDVHRLLAKNGTLAAKQVSLLFLLAYKVGVQRDVSAVGECARKYGNFDEAFCEYSKAFVRSFPLIGVVATLFVFGRTILMQRVYYGMLRRHILLNFENINPLQDRLFQLLAFSMLNCIAHFVQLLAHHDGSSKERLAVTKDICLLYAVPAGLFMLFFVQTYDIDQTLVPLNKYWEEDPERARASLGAMVYLEEGQAIAAIPQLQLSGTGDRKCTMGEAYAELASLAGDVVAAFPEDSVPAVARTRRRTFAARVNLLESTWPLRILLHPQIKDEEKESFQLMWRMMVAVSALVCLAVLTTFVYLVYHKAQDVYIKHQHMDLVGLLVVCLHLAGTVWITRTMLSPQSLASWVSRAGLRAGD